jgi:outer membrane immunogenic protein
MKKFVFSVAALAITAGGASAADMAVKAPVYRPAPIVDPWAGFYVGANVGYSWGD